MKSNPVSDRFRCQQLLLSFSSSSLMFLDSWQPILLVHYRHQLEWNIDQDIYFNTKYKYNIKTIKTNKQTENKP